MKTIPHPNIIIIPVERILIGLYSFLLYNILLISLYSSLEIVSNCFKLSINDGIDNLIGCSISSQELCCL